jgi:catechol 2,3-dioxygenase-like lactoylglutathione lyase family enzyme
MEAEEGLVSGLPEVALDVWCLVDDQRFSQIEMFEFQRPRMRPQPADQCRSDIGYSAFGVAVMDFDAALNRIRHTSGRLLTDPVGVRGQRRVCLRDPDGILIEIMESPPQPAADAIQSSQVALRSITISVPDLERASRFWVNTLGLTEADCRLHEPDHESMWRLLDARHEQLTLRSGHFLIELVHYHHPTPRARPAGYLLSDQGILNVAIGTMERAEFDTLFDRVRAAGYHYNSEPWTKVGVGTVVYLSDDCGISVELLHAEDSGLEELGFIAAE